MRLLIHWTCRVNFSKLISVTKFFFLRKAFLIILLVAEWCAFGHDHKQYPKGYWLTWMLVIQSGYLILIECYILKSVKQRFKSCYTWKYLAWIDYFIQIKCKIRIFCPVYLEFKLKCSKMMLQTDNNLGKNYFPFFIYLSEVKDRSYHLSLKAGSEPLLNHWQFRTGRRKSVSFLLWNLNILYLTFLLELDLSA